MEWNFVAKYEIWVVSEFPHCLVVYIGRSHFVVQFVVQFQICVPKKCQSSLCENPVSNDGHQIDERRPQCIAFELLFQKKKKCILVYSFFFQTIYVFVTRTQ